MVDKPSDDDAEWQAELKILRARSKFLINRGLKESGKWKRPDDGDPPQSEPNK